MSGRTVSVRFQDNQVAPGQSAEQRQVGEAFLRRVDGEKPRARKKKPTPEEMQAALALLETHLAKVKAGDPEAVALDQEVNKVLNRRLRETKRKLRAKSERELREHLEKLTQSVMVHLAYLDAVMKLPATELRGRVVAQLANLLDLANDHARHFGLGVSLKSIGRAKPKAAVKPEELAALRETLKAWVGGG